MTAVYDIKGKRIVLEVGLKTNEIPAKISDYLVKNYPKNKINNAAKVTTNNTIITYEIGITIEGRWTDAIFNKEGDFLRMVQNE